MTGSRSDTVVPLRVFVLTPGVGGMGGISRMMDWVDAEISRRPETNCIVTSISTRGDSRYFRPFVYLASIARLALACCTGRCDVLHVNLASFGSTYRKLPLAWLARVTRTPYLVHLHGGAYRAFWTSRSPRMTANIDAMFRHASRVLVLGTAWAGLVTERVPAAAARITLLPNAVPRPLLASRRRREPGQLTIAFVGRLNAEKGVPDLIAALAAMKDVPGWQAVLAGDGEIEMTRQAIRAQSLSERIEVPGWLSADKVDALWQRADIFVLPSHIENLPLSIIEAFAHGVPVVCTPVGSVPELVEDGRTGLIVPTGDAPALKKALVRLIEDAALRQRLADQGLADFAARFELRGYVDRLLAIWQDVACRNIVVAGTLSSTEPS